MAALPVFLTFTVVIIHIVFFIKKRFTFVHNAILYMVMAILSKNYLTIVTMELDLLKTTKNSSQFITLLLQRDIIIPLLIVLFINLYFRLSSWTKKLFLFVIIIAFMQVLDFLLVVNFKIVEFVDWNMYAVLLVNISYLLVGICISKFLCVLSERKGVGHDNYLR